MEPKSGWHFDNAISLDFDIEGHQILPPHSNDNAEKKVIPNLNENVLPKFSAEVPKATALKSILPNATLDDEFISTPNSNVTDTVQVNFVKSSSFCRTWGEHVVCKNCSECQKQFLYTTCSPKNLWFWFSPGLILEFSCIELVNQ